MLTIKKRSKKKKDCQIQHTIKRCLQRFGFHIKPKHIDRMRNLITSGEAEFVERQSLRIAVFRIALKGENALIINDRQRKTISTILREDDRNDDIYEGPQVSLSVEDITGPRRVSVEDGESRESVKLLT